MEAINAENIDFQVTELVEKDIILQDRMKLLKQHCGICNVMTD